MNEIMNPYGQSQTVTTPARSTADIEASRSIAEVQAAVLLAKKFPRNPIEAMDKILNECQRPTLAEQALYSYSRGGTDITGPSIRLAEAIARNWGNMEFGVKELSQSNGQSEVLSYAWDLENNTRQSKIFTVKHERYTKKGSYALSDPRDIYEQTANQAARRLRAAILSVIPGDVIDAAVSQCEATLKSKADTSPEATKKMVEAFANYGVSKEQIEKRIQRKLDSISPAQVISLRKIYNSLKDGMSAAVDWFDPSESKPPENGEQKKSGTSTAKDALRKAKEESKPVSVEMAPGPCPDGGPMAGDTPTAEHCGKCAMRDGCPVWPEKE